MRARFFEGDDVYPGANFAISAYRGRLKPDWWCSEDPWVNVNKVKSAVRSALPSLLYSNPKYRCTPNEPEMIQTPQGVLDVSFAKSKAKQAWLNQVFKNTNGLKHARVALLNSFLSYGVAKVGYRPNFEDDDKRGVFELDEAGNFILDEMGDPVLERGEYLTDENGEPVRDEDGIPIPHPGRLQKETWFVEACDPFTLLFDPDGGPDFNTHRYVVEEWNRPLEDVRRDPRFKPSARRNVAPTSYADADPKRDNPNNLPSWSSAVKGTTNQAVYDDSARVKGYDIYDFEEGRYMVIADDGNGQHPQNDVFLLDDPIPAGIFHGPFVFLKFTEDSGSNWYPIPDAIDMALVNQEYNITRSQMMIHREHTKTRYLETPGAFEADDANPEEERAKFLHGPDGTLIKVRDQNAILPAPKAQLDGSFFAAVPNIAADFNEVGGMPGEARGVADADTATQASILATGAEIRNNDRRDNQVQAFLSEIGIKLLQSAAANAEMAMRVLEDTEQGPMFFEITPDMLTGDVDVDVSIGSMLPKNDPRALSMLIQYLTALGQNPMIGQIKGLVERALDGLSIDPGLADEVVKVATAAQQAQMGAGPAGGGDVTQVLGQLLGGQPNAQGGASTGAPLNTTV